MTALFYELLKLAGRSISLLEQLQAVALLFLKVNDHGAGIALVFFGFYALLTGYLMFGVNEQRWKGQASAAGVLTAS